MLRRSRTRDCLLLFEFGTLAMVTGCRGNRDDTLRVIGLGVFGGFIVLFILTAVTHKLAELRFFQDFREKSRPILLPATAVMMLVGLAIAVFGSSLQGRHWLWTFVGVLIVVLSILLSSWSKSEDRNKQRFFLKTCGLVVGTILALLYLISGGQGLQ